VRLDTTRLVLHCFTLGDVDLLSELDSDPEVMRFLSRNATPRQAIETEILPRIVREYAETPGFGIWAAHTRETDEFIGWFELRASGDGEAELGYRLRRAAWGRGFATEGGRALIREAFTDLGVRRVWAQTMAVNWRSRRVMERCGLRYLRTFQVTFDDPLPGTEQGEVEYALLREEWLASQRPAGG